MSQGKFGHLHENVEIIRINLRKLKGCMVGDISFGGYTGYLGRYATCAIETETAVEGNIGDGAYNKNGHDKLITIKSAIEQFSTVTNNLSNDKNNDSQWMEVTYNFLEFQQKLANFFQNEAQFADETKQFQLAESNKLFNTIRNNFITTIQQACEIIANNTCYSINTLNPQFTPSPGNATKYIQKLKGLPVTDQETSRKVNL